MTDADSLKPGLGRYGVWTFGTPKPEQAVEIEKLGYGAVWIGGSPAGDLNYVEPILERTETPAACTVSGSPERSGCHRVSLRRAPQMPARFRYRSPSPTGCLRIRGPPGGARLVLRKCGTASRLRTRPTDG